MVQKLAKLRLLKYERYGVLILTEEGKMLGAKLLDRHNIIEKFLKILGIAETEILTETEKIEHAISKKTVECFEIFIEFNKSNQDITNTFKSYIEMQN